MGATNLMRIPLLKIRENPAALRAVDRQSENYIALVDSIRNKGVLNPIVVREIKDKTTGDLLYGLVDGLHRYTGSLDAGANDIPANIVSMDDGEVEEAQIIGNAHKIETKPAEYSKALMRVLSSNPTMTITELAGKLSKSTAWLSQMFGLLKLQEKYQKLVDDGKINLTNAYALAKLPAEEQDNFVERAMTLTPQEFVPTANQRKKELDTARRQGRDAAPAEFVPVAHCQKLADIKGELDSLKVASVLVDENKLTSALEGFRMGLQWVLHLDPRSVQIAKAKDDQRRKEAEDKKAKAAEERKKKKELEAKATAEKLQTA